MGTISVTEVYAGLRYADGARWPGSSITYSIPGSGAFWSPNSYAPGEEPTDPAYGVLNAAQRTAFIDALGAWERLINVDLVEVPDNGFSQGQIRIAFTDTEAQGAPNSAAYAYAAPRPGASEAAFQGDIWIDKDYKGEDASQGTYFYSTMLHELGHTLGLKHPFEGVPLPAEFDNTRYTIMSYTEFADSSFRFFALDGPTLFANTEFVNPATPMLLDIIAIQGIYGAANNVELGANTYTIDQDTAFMATIVDNGGIDTFDLSTHTRGSAIDLTPGAFSSIAYFSVPAQIAYWKAAFPGYSASFITDYLNKPDTYTWSNNLATSLDTVIENVIGGSGSDSIIGNAAANSLMGGGGYDSVASGAGNDTINGGSGQSYLRGDDGNDSIVGGSVFDDANGNMGNDTISTGAGEDYCVGGKDNDLLFGGGDYDLVYGNLGNDTCNGDDGDDIVRGGQDNDVCLGGNGNDFVSGDRGDDTMTGGAGADVFHTFGENGIDRVTDFSLAQGDRVQLDPGTQFTVAQSGGDTIISMNGGGQMILVGVQMSTLTGAWIFGA